MILALMFLGTAVYRARDWAGSCCVASARGDPLRQGPVALRGRSAEAFEIACGVRECCGHAAEFVSPGAIFGRGGDVFGRAPQLEEFVQQRGDFAIGQHDGVFGKPGALECASPFVGSLAARLAAVLPPPPYGRPLLQPATTPATVPHSTPPHPCRRLHQNVT